MWLNVCIQSLLWAVLWLVMGLAFLCALRIRCKQSLAALPLVPFFVLGVCVMLSPLVPWQPSFVALEAIILLAGAFYIGALRSRKGGSPDADGAQASFRRVIGWLRALVHSKCFIAGVIGVAINAILVIVTFTSVLPNPDLFTQQYDDRFHMSVIRHIAESANAFPVGAGSVAGSESALYPDLWHAIVALSWSIFGGSIQASIWVIVIALMAFITPVSLCVLAYALFGTRHATAFFFASLACAVLPYSLFVFATFGPLFPNLAGTALLPAALGWAMLLFDSKPLTQGIPQKALCLAVCAITLGLLHPNTVFTMTLFLLPLLVANARKIWSRAAIVAFFAACWGILFVSPFFARTVACPDRIIPSSDWGMRLLSKLNLDYASMAEAVFLPLLASAIIIGLGVLVAWLLRKKWASSWYVVGISIVGALLFCTFFPTNWFSVLATGFWYRDTPRLAVTLVFMTYPALCAVPSLCASAAGKATSRDGASNKIVSCIVIIAFVVAAAGMAFISSKSSRARVSNAVIKTYYEQDPLLMKPEQAAFMQEVAAIAGDGVVLNSNNDASAWLYPLYGTPSVINALPANNMSSMSDDELVLIESIDKIAEQSDTGARVREAARNLGVQYVLQLGGAGVTTSVYAPDGLAHYEIHDAANKITPSTPGFELVAEQDGMRLYKIDPDLLGQ